MIRTLLMLVLALALVFACSKSKSGSRGQTSDDPPPGTVLSQSNADALSGNFDGKVLRSSHPKVAENTRCEGTISRAKSATTAHVTVKCGDVQLYDGTGSFKLDVKDPSKRDDDRLEFDDNATSDVDKTPAVKLVGENGQADGTGGSLQVWDVANAQPPYTIVIAL